MHHKIIAIAGSLAARAFAQQPRRASRSRTPQRQEPQSTLSIRTTREPPNRKPGARIAFTIKVTNSSQTAAEGSDNLRPAARHRQQR